MAHDVFISYSSKNKIAADAICAGLEARGIRCWFAPRDVGAGNYGEAILIGIEGCRVLVLVFSHDSNISKAVLREAERAMTYGKTIIPFRLADVPMSRDLEFFLASCHWLDALSEPLADHIATLGDAITALLNHSPNPAEPWKPAGVRTPVPQRRRPFQSSLRSMTTWAVLALASALVFIAWVKLTRPKSDAQEVPQETTLVSPSLSVGILGTQDTSIQDYFVGVGQARVIYELERAGEDLRIRPACDYLRQLGANEPLEPVLAEASGGEYFQSPPVYLDLKLLNTSEFTIYFVEAVLEVELSKPSGFPLVVIDAASANAGQLRLVNVSGEPWPAVSLRYSVDEPGAVPFFGDYTHHAKIDELATRFDLKILPDGLQHQDQILCYGELAISAGTGRQSMRFQTLMPSRAPADKPTKAKAPSSAKEVPDPLKDSAYPVDLRAEGVNYEVPINVSQFLKPGETDRFCIAVKAPVWSSHRFRLRLFYEDRKQSVVTPLIDLEYFKTVSSQDS